MNNGALLPGEAVSKTMKTSSNGILYNSKLLYKLPTDQNGKKRPGKKSVAYIGRRINSQSAKICIIIRLVV